MTKTAQALATGPFHGFFSEGATLYRLDPPCVAGGPTKRGIKSKEVHHIIVQGMDASEEHGYGPETAVFATDEAGVVDTDFYLTHGCVVELLDRNDPEAALARLGYGS